MYFTKKADMKVGIHLVIQQAIRLKKVNSQIALK